ncbi:hypothetical protein HS088_TW11G01025 [Tripterygium wilfordii]|uniref:J domain-containing protein n=1 Tax=Tripterygium wilfordii TaxID=458696 RepID=A0A7J7D3P4_TRIWF|nr:DNAJ protein JJJ1 homolog [Tripterygium wilfordii]KAF5740943.1 hypothetical protein HS088_TW11G01025 [Tripterygium wilfordii]
MALEEDRCPYHVLGIPIDSTAEEIRSAYKKLALQLHPDKSVNSGVESEEATAQFQKLIRAYEILSNDNSRAVYNSGGGYGDPFTGQTVEYGANEPGFEVPDFFSFPLDSVFTGYGHTGRGFYRVYAGVFNKIYQTELDFVEKFGPDCDPALEVLEPPDIGNLGTRYEQVMEFYDYWFRFCTVIEFGRTKKKEKQRYNESVRRLARMVKYKDKRVIDEIERKVSERERRKEETRQLREKLEMEKKEKERKKKEEEIKQLVEKMEISEKESEMGTKKKQELRKFRERMVEKKMERLKKMEEAKKSSRIEENEEEMGGDDDEGSGKLLCIVCERSFKSKKQWNYHKKSKEHRIRVTGTLGILSFGEDDDAELEDGVGELGQQFVKKMTSDKWRSMSLKLDTLL